MKKRFAVIAILIMLVLIFFVTRLSQSKDETRGEQGKAPRVAGQVPSLKKMATRHVSLRSTLSFPRNLSSELIDDFAMPENLPRSCKDYGLIKKIVESDIDALIEASKVPTDAFQSCLLELGGPKACFGQDTLAEDGKNCWNNFIIARARLINALSEGKAPEGYDDSILANKIIAKVYSDGERSVDTLGPEIFRLADALVNSDGQNPEAHNLRAYFTIQSLKQDFDAAVLDKGKDSASFLSQSPDARFAEEGLTYDFGFDLFSM